MIDKKKRLLEKDLRRIELQIKTVSGIRKRRELLKKQLLLKKELRSIGKKRS